MNARDVMEKRVTFNERWLPYLLVAPQIVITLVFFFWPSGQAIWQSVISEDAFGGNTQVRLVRQFQPSLQRPELLRVSAADAGVQLPGRVARARHLAAAGGDGRPHHPRRLGLQDHPGLALCRGAGGGGRAVRLPVQSLGRRRRLDAGGDRHRVQLRDQRQPGAAAGGVRRRLEPGQLQFPVLPRRPAVDPQVADRGRRHRRRGPGQALLGHRLPAAVAHRLLPAGDQHHLRLLRHLRHCRLADPGRAGPGHQHPDLEGLQRRLSRPGSRRLVGAVGDPDDRGDRCSPSCSSASSSGGCTTDGREPALRDVPQSPHGDRRPDHHRLSGVDDVRRLDPRPGDHAAVAGADLAGIAPARELLDGPGRGLQSTGPARCRSTSR